MLYLHVNPKTGFLVSGKTSRSKLILSLLIMGPSVVAGGLLAVLALTRELNQPDCYSQDKFVTITTAVVSVICLCGVAVAIFTIHRHNMRGGLLDSKISTKPRNQRDPQIFRHDLLLLPLFCAILATLLTVTYRISVNFVIDNPGSIAKIFLYLNQTFTLGSGMIYLAVFLVDCCTMLDVMREMFLLLRKKIEVADMIFTSVENFQVNHLSKKKSDMKTLDESESQDGSEEAPNKIE